MIYIQTLSASKFQCLITVKIEKQITSFFSWDNLTIYDGSSSASSMLGKYCGNSIPPSHISSSKEIMVHFRTASWITGLYGFKMEYNPTGKQNTSIQNNTEYLGDRYFGSMYSSFVDGFFLYRIGQNCHFHSIFLKHIVFMANGTFKFTKIPFKFSNIICNQPKQDFGFHCKWHL